MSGRTTAKEGQGQDIHLTPAGHLLLDGEPVAGEMLARVIGGNHAETAMGLRYLKRVLGEYLHRLVETAGTCHDTGDDAVFRQALPTQAEADMAAMAMPPVTGSEYWNGELLRGLCLAVESLLREGMRVDGSDLLTQCRRLIPGWQDVGKLSLHLAENKADTTGTHPFAFMVSFIYSSQDGKQRHLPFADALRLYSGNQEAMKLLLQPLEQVAVEGSFVAELLATRRIFSPCAWTGEEAFRFLQEAERCRAAGMVVRVFNLWKTKSARPALRVTLDKKGAKLGAKEMLSCDISVLLGGEPITRAELEALAKGAGQLVQLRGEWVELDPGRVNALLKQWKNAEAMARSGVTFAEGLRALAGGGWDFSRFPDTEFSAGGGLKGVLESFRSPAGIKLPALPGKLGGILRPYQQDGVRFLWGSVQSGLGVCLADDMGLGKTLQVLTLLALLKKKGSLKGMPALLVLPATLLSNWRSEAAKFTPQLKTGILHPSALSAEERAMVEEAPAEFLSRYDVVLTSYGIAARMESLQELEFPIVVADEAQAIKTASSNRSQAVRCLKSPCRIALTGTPVENSYADLWSLFDFINPGLLGSRTAFKEFTAALGDDYSPLRRLVRPFILRRLKTDKSIISDLPDKTEVKENCLLGKKQAALYLKCQDQMKEQLEAEDLSPMQRRGLVLSYLMRFKQICNHPDQFTGTGDYSPKASGKFMRLAELAETVASRQEKMLVFTQFREMTGPLHDFLAQCFGRQGLVLHGGTPVKRRAALVDEFQREGGAPFFVISLKAGGTGLNLTAANHVVHFDRWWNPAVENQASDRAYRIGQKRNVLIHPFICEGTIEERIDQLLEEKQQAADLILDGGGEKLLTEMDTDELMALVGLNLNHYAEED